MLAVLLGCNDKPSAVAQLSKSDGDVSRQPAGSNDAAGAMLGTQYFIGDAALTGRESTATLDVSGGKARIIMQSLTVLRFGGKPGQSRIEVDVGAIDLTGTGDYLLGLSKVTMPPDGGTVRVTSKSGNLSTFELVVGTQKAQVDSEGQIFDLVLGQSIDIDNAARVPRDAGAQDAAIAVDAADAVDALDDAALDAASQRIATIAVTGRRAELLAPGETVWKRLPPGAGQLAPGSAIRLRAGTTARITAGGTTLELGGGARFKLGEDFGFAVELGASAATATEAATIALPGGAVALAGEPDAPATARLEGNARETKITMLRGGSRLTGAGGAEHAMSRGESASLGRNGAIRVLEAIPRYFDLRVSVNESMAIHDPRLPTSVQFQFDGKCPDGGFIEVDRDPQFRTPRVSGGRDFANVLLGRGAWSYRLRCTTRGTDGGKAASGRITVDADDGRRPLPKNQSLNDIADDGRKYTITYQSTIPDVAVHVRNPGATHRLHLALEGKEQTFESSTSTITVPGSRLREGLYTYWIDRDGVKQDKISTLLIDFDQAAPKVYIESPINGQPWTGDIDVRGAVLPGWSAWVEAFELPIDRHRRFAAKAGIPGGNALAIRLSHPKLGVHYYLRRPK